MNSPYDASRNSLTDRVAAKRAANSAAYKHRSLEARLKALEKRVEELETWQRGVQEVDQRVDW